MAVIRPVRPSIHARPTTMVELADAAMAAKVDRPLAKGR